MINKNGKCTNKLGICLNVLLHYSNYKKLDCKMVEIIKNDGLPQYSKLIGELGYVCNFEFENFKKYLIVYFPKIKKECCFATKELKLFER